MRNSFTGPSLSANHALGASKHSKVALNGVNTVNPMSPQEDPRDMDEDEYYEEEDDGTTPGPGAYFNP